MHVLLSYASAASPACREVLDELLPHLPNLRHCLRTMTQTAQDDGTLCGGAFSRSTPAERALARAVGLPDDDGRIPWAAWQRRWAGLPTAAEGQELAWAEVTPCHWHVGLDHIVMENPSGLDLSAEEAGGLLDALHPLFAPEGVTLSMATPGRWWAQGEVFRGLQTASVARVAGRNVDAWMPEGAHQPPGAKLLRRLQNEVQMLLYQHPVNDARLARGAQPVNSVWFSQCGALPEGCISSDLPETPPALGPAAMAEDWAAYADAWRELDATWLARPDLTVLTLCGETGAIRLEAPAVPQRRSALAWWPDWLRVRRGQATPLEQLMALSVAQGQA